MIAGSSDQPLLLDMNPHFDTAHLSQATQDALSLIGINPDGNGNYSLGSLMGIIDFRTFAPMSTGPSANTALAGEVLLESVGDHYIAGDGRANENFGLTTIHHVFHEEHNYQIDNIQNAIYTQDTTSGDPSHAVLHAWQIDTHAQDANGNFLNPDGSIAWDADKMFNAAKLTVEMEYQHTAVDQYARSVTPDIPEFVGYSTGQDRAGGTHHVDRTGGRCVGYRGQGCAPGHQ